MREFAGFMCLLVAGCSAAEKPVTTFERVAKDNAIHGERISAVLGCTGCHGKDLQGRDWSDELGVLWTANLTRSAEKYTDEQLVAMITTGRKPGRELHGMPSHIFTHLAPEDLAAVIAFIRSKPPGGEVHPEPTFGPELEKMLAEGTLKSSAGDVAASDMALPPELGPQHALGRYIVRATCAECHDLNLKGGSTPFPGDTPRPDLTQVVPSYDTADFVTLMRTGKAAGNREVGLMSEVARNRFARFTDTEVEAVREYIVAVGKAQDK